MSQFDLARMWTPHMTCEVEPTDAVNERIAANHGIDL